MTSEVIARMTRLRQNRPMLPSIDAPPGTRTAPSLSDLLRAWRRLRRWSQLELALAAGVSQRHLSFVESGRSQPSRALLLDLAHALDLPLRERNLLLHAGGFAPVYEQRSLSDADMASVRQALELTLQHHEPCPAMVLDRHWNMLMGNAATDRFIGLLGDANEVWRRVDPGGRRNVLRLSFHPQGMRPLIRNWHHVGPLMLARLQREGLAAPMDQALQALHQELSALADLPATAQRLRAAGAVESGALTPTAHIELGWGPHTLRIFSMLSTFGAAQDVTTDELRIETFFPADALTADFFKALASSASAPG